VRFSFGKVPILDCPFRVEDLFEFTPFLWEIGGIVSGKRKRGVESSKLPAKQLFVWGKLLPESLPQYRVGSEKPSGVRKLDCIVRKGRV